MLDWLQRDWCSSLVLALGHFVWQGIAIALVLAIGLRIARAVSLRYWLSLCALLLMAVCPLGTFVVLLPSADVPVTPHPLPQASNLIDQDTAQPSTAVPSNPSSPPMPNGPVTLPSMPVPPVSDVATAPSTSWRSFAPLVMSLYLVGVSVMLVRLVIGLWGGRRLRSLAVPVTDESLLVALQRQATRLGLKALPLLAYCERVTVPTVIGILKPTILLPLSVASGLSPDQIESVLAHELAHLRRYDHLVNLLQRVIVSFLFFHPAVWWVSNRIRDEREHCCDDLVVAGGAAPLDYAQSLLRVAELSRDAQRRGRRNPDRSLASASLMATGDRPSTLRQRIARLLGCQSDLNVRAAHPWLFGSIAAVCLGTVWMLTAMSWVAVAETQPEKPSVQEPSEKPAEANTLEPQGDKSILSEFASIALMRDELAKRLPQHWRNPKVEDERTIAMLPGSYFDRKDSPYVLLMFTDDKTRPKNKWDRPDEQYKYLGQTAHGHAHLFVSMKIAGEFAQLHQVMALFDWPEATEFVQAFVQGDQSKLRSLEDRADDRYWAREGWGPIKDGLRVRWVKYTSSPAVGKPLSIGLELKNFGTTPQTFDLRMAHPRRSWRITGPDGEFIPFERGEQITSDHQKTLQPNSEISLFGGVDLTKHVNLSKPGRYRMSFTGLAIPDTSDIVDPEISDTRSLPAASDLEFVLLDEQAAKAEKTETQGPAAAQKMDPKTLGADWGPPAAGLRCRVIPVSATRDEDATDAPLVVNNFKTPEDVAFVVEFVNVTDKPISILDTRYGDGYGDSKGKANSNWYGQFLFSIDLFRDGKKIERPDVQIVDLDHVISNAFVKTLQPGILHRFVLRPTKWLSALAQQFEPGRYDVVARYHGLPARVARRIKEYRPESPVLVAIEGDVASSRISFEVAAPENAPPKRDLVWGPPVNGLRTAAEIVPRKDLYAHGERPETRLHVQNVGDKPVTLASHLWMSDLGVSVKNDKGEAVELAHVWYSGWTTSCRTTLQPQQIVVFDAGNIGLAATKEQADKFEDVTHRRMVAPPGKYTLELSGRFGNSFLLKDGKGKVLAPLEGDWIGELTTGATPLTITKEVFKPFDCDIVDAATGQPVKGTTVNFRFIKPKSGNSPETIINDLFWGPQAPSRIYFMIPNEVFWRPDRDDLELAWGVGQHPDYEVLSAERIPLKQLIDDNPASARNALRTIKLTRKASPETKDGNAKLQPIPASLELRFVAQLADASAEPRIPADFAGRHYPDNSKEGRAVAKDKGFCWFPISALTNDINLPMQAVTNNRQRIALLADTPEHALLADGKWSVEDCRIAADVNGRYTVELKLNEAGGKAMQTLAKSHLNQQLAVVIDGEIVTAPVVRDVISRDLSVTGNFSREQASRLVAAITSTRPSAPNGDDPKDFKPSAEGEIAGMLIDAVSGEPIVGATIACGAIYNESGKLGGANAVTNAVGRYRMAVPSPGIYKVWVKAHQEPGKAAAADCVLVQAGRASSTFLKLTPARKITGKVVDSDGNPVGGIQVNSASSADISIGTKSKEDGTFEFLALPGRATMYASESVPRSDSNPFGIGRQAHAYVSVTADKLFLRSVGTSDLQQVESVTLTLKQTEEKFGDPKWLIRSTPGTQILRREGNKDVSGTVVDTAGMPIAGAKVIHVSKAPVTANDKGEFHIETDKGTQFVMYAFAPGYEIWFGTPTSGDVLKIVLETKEK